MITLDDLSLPPDLWWSDETDWCPVDQSADYSLEGSLIVEESVKQAGRTITLEGGNNRAWVRRSLVLQLQAMAAEPGKEMELVIHDQRFTVIFRRSAGLAVEARSKKKMSPPADQDYYTLVLRFLVI